MRIFKKTITRNSKETQKIAYGLAKKIAISKINSFAKILVLTGNLGAGKTTFVQGFAQGLGVKQRIVSPTFLIFRSYKLSSEIYKKLYHVDAYRIKKNRELLDLGFKEILSESRNIVLIEWGDKIKKILPPKTIWIKFEHGKDENERTMLSYKL